MGERPTATKYYPIFQAMCYKWWGADITINQLRHLMIGVGREFLRPTETFLAWQKSVAASSDHSFEVETSHYAIPFDDLPRLTSSKIWEARSVAHEWWGVIGALGADAPPPLPIRSRPVVDVEDLSTQILKRVEEQLQTLLPGIIARVLPASDHGEYLNSAVFALTE